jgi:hypothetical protein
MGRRLTLGIGDNREHCFYIPVGFQLIRLYINNGFVLEELVRKQHGGFCIDLLRELVDLLFTYTFLIFFYICICSCQIIKRQRYCSAFGLGTYLCVQFDFLVFTHEFIATFRKVPCNSNDTMESFDGKRQ